MAISVSSGPINSATIGTLAFSGTTLLLCLGGIFHVYNDIQKLWLDLDAELDLLKVSPNCC